MGSVLCENLSLYEGSSHTFQVSNTPRDVSNEYKHKVTKKEAIDLVILRKAMKKDF
jgi:hypothetical protein